MIRGVKGIVGQALVVTFLAGGVLAQNQRPTREAQPDNTGRAVTDRFVIAAGKHECVTTNIEIEDADRGKSIKMRVRVPRAPDGEAPAEGWPMLVFSHGAGGSRNAFPGLLDFLASHGFASVAITHDDSIALKREREGARPGDARELKTPDGRRELLRSVKLGERVKDCSFVLDHTGEISQACTKAGGPAFNIDPSRVAIAGHSAGAFTTQLLAGAKVRAATVGAGGLRFTSVADERFKAAVIISGQGTTSRALGEDSWDEIEVPIMVFSGSLDGSPPNMGNETPRSRTEPYTRSRGVEAGGPPAYLLYIEGATHGSYQGTQGASELIDELLGDGEREQSVGPATDLSQVGDATNTSVLIFLRAFLNKEQEARETLDSSRIADTIPGKVEYKHK